MSDKFGRSWDEAMTALGRAARELRETAGRVGEATPEEAAAKARLKEDVSQLERSAAELFAKVSASLEREREGIESSADREQAERSSGQIKSALEELAALAAKVANDVAGAASGSVRQAEPEMKAALGTLDDVVKSAGQWLRVAIVPESGKAGGSGKGSQPPLDDL